MPHLSPARRAGNLIFVSGQLGVDDDFQITGDCAAQTRTCMDRIAAILADHGAGLGDIVKITAWLTDRADFMAYDRVYAECLGDYRPARSTVICDLALADASVEIEAVAWIEGQ